MTDTSYTKTDFNPSGKESVADIKAKTEELITFIERNVPEGRRRSLAITNYEQAAMWAVKACFD
jgi:hypothetical protein